jgi:pimeloyl-ACP methyl ester carboxylesterase
MPSRLPPGWEKPPEHGRSGGGTGEAVSAQMMPLHFSHANGFPAACYRKMFSFLEPEFEIGYINTIGHDPRFPVTDNWPHLVDELIEYLCRHYREPVVGVGHSLGGYLTTLAALERPELFRALIVLDSPVFGALTGAAFGMVKRFSFIDRVTPAGATRGRRSEWASSEEAFRHFHGRKTFRNFDPDCLRDYVTLGMVPTAHGIRLAFDPAIEARIYRALPHGLVRRLPRLAVPAGFICGRESEEMRRVGLASARKFFHLVRIPGGHLFPFEQPEAAARAIRDMAAELLRRARHRALDHAPGALPVE